MKKKSAKIIAVALSAAMGLSLTACGSAQKTMPPLMLLLYQILNQKVLLQKEYQESL